MSAQNRTGVAVVTPDPYVRLVSWHEGDDA
jgi:hypothetical protein